MEQTLHCPNCDKDFHYEQQTVTGGSKGVDSESEVLGTSRGIFDSKPKTKQVRAVLECPHCQKEDFFKVTIEE